MKEYAIAALTGLLANTELVNTKEVTDKKELAILVWDIAEEMANEEAGREREWERKDRAYRHTG